MMTMPPRCWVPQRSLHLSVLRLKQQGQEGATPHPREDYELEQGPQLSDALVDWLRALGSKRLGDQWGKGLEKDFAEC